MKKNKQKQKQFQKLSDSSDFDVIKAKITPSSTSQQIQQQQLGCVSSANNSIQTLNPNVNSQTDLINLPSSHNTGTQNVINNRLANSINCNQLRAGDWVCLLCNNLNFSFRNECNRCMIQTKKKNLMQNLMLVQDESQSYLTEINKNNERPSQMNVQVSNIHQNQLIDHQDTQNNIQIIESDNVIHDNFKQIYDDQKKNEGIQEENHFEYNKYLNKGGCGFENKLLLLTPHRSSIQIDEYYDQRIENTTAPQSNNSNCKSESDVSKNSKRQKMKAMSNGSTNIPLLSSCANSDKIQFNEDIFISSNKKDITGVAIQFSSPEDSKCIIQQQQILGHSNGFNAFGPTSQRSDEGKNVNQPIQQEEKREFQLFGTTNPNNNCPHFISSPSSMRDDEESLNESDSGNFQQEIQQQINNIMQGEEEDEILNKNNNDITSIRKTDNQVENNSFFHSKEKDSNFIFGQQHIQLQNQVGDEKQSFSFGGNLLSKSRNENNFFNNSRQVEIVNEQNNLEKNMNQKQFLSQNNQLYENNNTKTGFFNFNSNKEQLANSNQNHNNGLHFNNYTQFFNSNTFSQQKQQSNFNDLQQKNSNIFGELAIKENEKFNIFSNKNSIPNTINPQYSDSQQGQQIFNQQNSNKNNLSSNNNNFFSFIDDNSNTVPVNNIFSKINQYEKYYQQQDLTNQYTINFEQASSFINKNKQQSQFSQKMTGRGTALYPTPIIDDFADMSDFEDEEFDSNSESRIMRSTKKSNNIRKKKTKNIVPTSSVEMKKKNKLNLQSNNTQPNSYQQGIGIEQNHTTSFNNLNQYHNFNQNFNQHSNHSNQFQNASNSFQNIPNLFKTSQFHNNASKQDYCVEQDSRVINDSKQYQINESEIQDMNIQQKQLIINNNSSQHQTFIQSQCININSANPQVVNNATQNSQGVNSFGGNSLNGQINVKKQDWICPRCENLNFSFRKLCNKCQFAKNNFAIHIPPNFQSIQQQLTIF